MIEASPHRVGGGRRDVSVWASSAALGVRSGHGCHVIANRVRYRTPRLVFGASIGRCRHKSFKAQQPKGVTCLLCSSFIEDGGTIIYVEPMRPPRTQQAKRLSVEFRTSPKQQRLGTGYEDDKCHIVTLNPVPFRRLSQIMSSKSTSRFTLAGNGSCLDQLLSAKDGLPACSATLVHSYSGTTLPCPHERPG